MKRWIAVLACLALAAGLFTGCGSSGGTQAANSTAAYDSAAGERPEAMPAEGENGLGGDGTRQLTPQDGRKIIYNASLELESKQFEAARDALLEAAAKAKGYVQESGEGGSAERGTRWVNYTFRIPSEQYGAFLGTASEAGNLLSKSESTQDVTADYVDIEARLDSLRTQEERLLELAGQAEKLEDLLAIEEQLTQVRYQIESYTGQRRVYDSLISYSTVDVHLSEVQALTPTDPGFGTKLGAAFRGSWTNFVEGLQGLLIGLIYALPTLIVLGLAALAAALVLRAVRRRRPPRPKTPSRAVPPLPGQEMTPPPAAPAREKDPPKYGPQQ
ncbi:DUF4349 domain-containing protein [Allofournierella sp.]|uniref:DUF4349 domain-containing protein n=1 Tax=Allofournierella sp. TaxID=1940256 RepID=UPI003AB5FA59